MTDEQLDRLRWGPLDERERPALEGHLARCPGCRARLEASGAAPSDAATAVSPQRAAASAALDLDIPGYDMLRELHRGGQGIVFLAVQKSTKREVAIKVLREGPLASASDAARFEREVELLARLDHPNIVSVFDRGRVGPWQYFVMKYVAGRALDRWAATPRPFVERLRLFEKLCRAVQAAHAHGVVHRDLKPSNVRVDEGDEPHVLDFGLAKSLSTESLERSPTLTETGQFMGSLPWASPEHAAAIPSRIDARSDVYSLGVMLYQLLVGRLPYDVSSNLRVAMDRILYTLPRPPSDVLAEQGGGSQTGVNRELDTITLKCLRKEPERRYADAGALADDLQRFLAGEPVVAQRDSVGYLARKRVGHWVRAQPAVTLALLGLLACVVAERIGVPLAFRWTGAQTAFHRLAVGGMPLSTTMPLARVRLLDLPRQIDWAELSRLAGVDPPCTADQPRCLRMIHGRLLERLAQTGVLAVAIDIRFSGPSPFDPDLIRGLTALRDAGVPVVLATDTWSDHPAKFPGVEPSIAEAAQVASNPGGFGENNWEYYLAVDKNAVDARPSLALATFAASLQPRSALSLRLDWASKTLTLLFQDAAGAAARRPASGGVSRLRVSAISRAGPNAANFDLQSTDLVAFYYLDLPDDAAIAAARVEYAQALAATPESLRDTVGGRVVLISDLRPPDNYARTPDGRTLCKSYAHAFAVDQLLRDAPIRIPSPGIVRTLTVLAAVSGLALGWRLASRWGARLGAYVAAATLILAACLLVAWTVKFLFPPSVALLGVIAAGELASAARRLGGAPADARC